MTIRVRVENLEADAGRHVRIREVNIEKTGRRSNGAWEDIPPGSSREFHIHLLKDLEVSEQHPEHRND